MTMSATLARTGTFSEARARDVMLEIGADFYALAAAKLISWEAAERWTEELGFILLHEAAYGFQIQFHCQGHSPRALDYRVSSDGSILESGTAGGINYYGLPPGTVAGLLVQLNYGARKIAVVQQYLATRNWGIDGQAVEGAAVRDRVYSKDGYGVIRSKPGLWP
jgi:hypothetical protein